MKRVRNQLLYIDVIPHRDFRKPWRTWRPAGETFWYLRAFTFRTNTYMVGLIPRKGTK